MIGLRQSYFAIPWYCYKWFEVALFLVDLGWRWLKLEDIFIKIKRENNNTNIQKKNNNNNNNNNDIKK